MRAFGGARAFDGGGGGGAASLPISGGVMTGDIDMNGNSIIRQTLVQVTTAISATTAALGWAHEYIATATSITITISSADIVDGRPFVFRAIDAATSVGTPVTIATEGAELIDGQASALLTQQYDSITLTARGGNLESVS